VTLTIPNTFVSGQTASASTMNANFTAVKTEVDLKPSSDSDQVVLSLQIFG
jgi:hypothetical protein